MAEFFTAVNTLNFVEILFPLAQHAVPVFRNARQAPTTRNVIAVKPIRLVQSAPMGGLLSGAGAMENSLAA